MSRWFRWILYGMAGVFVLLIAAYVAAQIYKPKILASINEQLKKGIHGDVHIGGLDFTLFHQFPSLSITLSDMYLRGPQYAVYHQDFFNAKKVYVQVSFGKLIQGNINLKSITVKNAMIHIFTAANGYTNLDVFKHDKADSTGNASFLSLDFEKIKIENAHVLITDSVKQTFHEVTLVESNLAVKKLQNVQHFDIQGKVDFGGLMFSKPKGSYLKNKQPSISLSLDFDTPAKKLMILPSVLQFEKSAVTLTGELDLADPGRIRLQISSQSLDYPEALTIVTQALRDKLGRFMFAQPITLLVSMDGLLAGGEPKVVVNFSSTANHFNMGKLEIQDFSFNGNFMNHVDTTKLFDDPNSRVVLDSFSGKFNSIPTKGTATLTNLADPQITLKTISEGTLADLNDLADSEQVKITAGHYKTEINYMGKLNEYLDSTVTRYSGKLAGRFYVNKGAFEFSQWQKKFDNLNVSVMFTEKEMKIDKMMFNINGNKVDIKGNVVGFIPLVIHPTEKAVANLSVYSPLVNLKSLIKKKMPPQKLKAPQKPFSQVLNELREKVEFNLQLKADKILNGPFQGDQFSGKISFYQDQLRAEKMKMKIAEGAINVRLTMAGVTQPISSLKIETELNNGDIKKIFTAFNNFNQSAITAENLHGRLSTNVALTIDLDEQFKVMMPSLQGHAQLRIKDGIISHFAPLENMSNFLFKKRDFSEVQFAEINSRFDLAGTSLRIERMEIQSSLLSLFLEGRYSLADSTDLSIQIPLSNLKRRDKTYQPQNIGTDTKLGPSVFLRALSKDGKTVISYDMFKKFRKKKSESVIR